MLDKFTDEAPSRKVGSMAVAYTDDLSTLNDPKFDSGYYQTISKITEKAGENTLLGKILALAYGAEETSKQKSQVRDSIEAFKQLPEGPRQVIAKTYYRLLEKTTINSMPKYLGKALKEGQIPEHLSDDVRYIAEGIKNGDKFLKTKLIVDSVTGMMQENSHDMGSQIDFRLALIQAGIPELKGIRLDEQEPNLRQKLIDYDIAPYLSN